MRNSHVMLLGLLGFLLARQGVQGLECYSCNDCPMVDSSTPKDTCSASCLTVITCQDGDTPFVSRMCTLTEENNGCVKSTTSSNTYNCYCNEDNCDSYAANPNICNSAVSAVASHALVFVALLFTSLIG